MHARVYYREEPASSAFYPRRNNVRTYSPSEADPAPLKMNAVVCSPLPNPHGLTQAQLQTHASSLQRSHGQQTLSTQQRFHPDYDAVHVSGDKKLQRNSPLLLELLTSNNSNNMLPLSQKSKSTPQTTAETFVSSSRPMTPPSRSREYLNNDQIFERIEKRLAIYKEQMKLLKERGFFVTDSVNSYSQVRPTPSTSAPGALDGQIFVSEKEASDSRRHSPQQSGKKNNGTATARQSAGTPLLRNSLHLPFFHKNTWYTELTSNKDTCIAEEYTYSKDNYSPIKSVLMDTCTIHYSLPALKELISSLDNVETPHKEIFVDNILQTYWNGKLDNIHLFTSTEYIEIMQEAAAVCSKKEGSPVVLSALGSFATAGELVKKIPTLTLNPEPPNREYKSTWRNVDQCASLNQEGDPRTLRNMMGSLPSGAESSELSQSSPISSAFETSDRETCPVAKECREVLPQSSADSGDVRTDLSQNTNSNTEFADKASGPDGNVKVEHEQQQFNVETPKKQVQTGKGEMGRGLFDRMFEKLKNPNYEDITDDEEDEANMTSQITNHDTSLQSKDIQGDHLPERSTGHLAKVVPASQLPKISMSLQLVKDIGDDEVTGNESLQVETSRPPEQNYISKGNCCSNAKVAPAANPSPKRQLVCTCPYLVETEDGFEEGLCPKCVQDFSSQNGNEDISRRQEGGPKDYEDARSTSGCYQSEADVDPPSEEDEWLVVPLIASDVKHEQEIVDNAENDNEANEFPSSLEVPNLRRFQKIQEFDTLASFIESKSKQFNVKLPLEPTNTTPSKCWTAFCNLTKLGPGKNPASELASAAGAEAEDSCDTDDSSDYPLQTKRNYITVSSKVRAPSPQICISDSAEEGEVPQLHETVMPGPPPESPSSLNKFFPDTSTDEDEDSVNKYGNNTTVSSTVRGRGRKETSPVNIKRHKTKTVKKARSKSPVSDDELSQGRYLSNKASAQSRQLLSKPESRPDQNGQNAASVSRHVHQNQAVKRKGPSTTSTSDHVNKKLGKRKRLSPDRARKITEKPQLVAKIPKLKIDVASGHTAKHKANPLNANASQIRKQKSFSRQQSQPILGQSNSTRGNATFPTKAPAFERPPWNGTLSLDGKKYHASSLPGDKQGWPKPPKSSISQPNRVNSYNTDKSTPAKQNVVKQWQENYVPTQQKRRRSSYERHASDSNATTKTAAGRDCKMTKPTARRRHNSHEAQLMKRTKNEAMLLTKQTLRQASTELNPDLRFNPARYKWKNQNATNNLDWERETQSPVLPKGLTEL